MINRTDKTIAFYYESLPLFGHSTGAVLMLSVALHEQGKLKPPETMHDGWWPCSHARWFTLTGLTRYQQEAARKRLNKHDFWRERVWGYPAKNEFRLDIAPLEQALAKNTRTMEQQDEHTN